jgi:hypothetical protein
LTRKFSVDAQRLFQLTDSLFQSNLEKQNNEYVLYAENEAQIPVIVAVYEVLLLLLGTNAIMLQQFALLRHWVGGTAWRWWL